MFQNRVLKRIFGPKRDDVTGDWRKLHNEELHKLVLLAKHIQNDQVKEDEMDRARSTNGGDEECVLGYCWETQKERDH
jgi:hypothetical protein